MSDLNLNRKRPAGKAMPNMYLITIPRCDLPKKFIFKGLEPICNRLLVSKEKHTINYIDSCCKNSSIKKKSLVGNKEEISVISKENYYFNIINNDKLSEVNRIFEENEFNRNDCEKIDCSNETNDFIVDPNGSMTENGIFYIGKKRREDGTKSQCNGKNLNIQDRQTEEDENWIHCKSHLHIFAEFNEEYVVDFDKCNRIMNWCADGYKSNIEACKSAKNAIVYCTKEDSDPLLKNINPIECSFYKKLIDWIKANPEINYYDPFICSRPNFYKMIILAHTDYYKKNPIQVSACYGLNTIDLETNGNKTKTEILKWFNECVSNWRLKFPALYLWGDSNTGKTTMIFDWLLANIVNDLQIFRPARNCQFAWADFDSIKHRVVVMDEFEFSQFDNEEWKNLVEGRQTAVRVKGRSSKVICVKCPIIMISNYPPPFEKKEIVNRLNVVKSEQNDIQN